MKWTKGSQDNGYTIVETMIVLAVSATMLISAMAFINGRQGRTEFSNAVRSFETSMADIASDVSSGYYSSPRADAGANRCRVTTGGQLQPDSAAVPAAARGASQGCIFIGVAVQFAPKDDGGYESMVTYGLLGTQYKDGNVDNGESRSINDSKVAVIPQSRTVRSIGSGATVGCVKYSTNPAFKVATSGGVAPCSSAGSNHSSLLSFLTTYQGIDVSIVDGKEQDGGSSQVDMLVSKDSTMSGYLRDEATVTAALENSKDPKVDAATATTVRPAGGLYVCLQSGGSNQYAIINLGGQSSRFNSVSTIYSGKCT